MVFRGFRCALGLLLLPIAPTMAGEINDWSDAPAEWITGIDYSAFCAPGDRSFEMDGEFVAASAGVPAHRQRISAAGIFFGGSGKGGATWIKHGPKLDELTSLRMRRDEDGALLVEGSAGETLAVSRKFESVTKSGGFWTRKVDSTQCKQGDAQIVELVNYQDSWSGGSSVRRARLALAADDSLIVRVDSYSCWLCFFKNRERQYARFRAIGGAAQAGVSD